MSTLLTRIMLTIFMLPAAATVYFGVIVLAFELNGYGSSYEWRKVTPFLAAGIAAWTFLAFYWLLLWRNAFNWNAERISRTAFATVASVILGLIAGAALYQVEDEVGAFFGTVVGPLTWLILTTFVWRETASERAARASGTGGVACPNCGYNLTGLRGTRCPECGTEFTLDALLSARAAAGAGLG